MLRPQQEVKEERLETYQTERLVTLAEKVAENNSLEATEKERLIDDIQVSLQELKDLRDLRRIRGPMGALDLVILKYTNEIRKAKTPAEATQWQSLLTEALTSKRVLEKEQFIRRWQVYGSIRDVALGIGLATSGIIISLLGHPIVGAPVAGAGLHLLAKGYNTSSKQDKQDKDVDAPQEKGGD